MKDKTRKSILLANIVTFINQTDIHFLVYIPPIFAFGILLLFSFLFSTFPEVAPPLPLIYIGLSVVFFIGCFSGIVEVYKKEMPGPMGGVVKGKMAIISGIIITAVSAISGFVALVGAFLIK